MPELEDGAWGQSAMVMEQQLKEQINACVRTITGEDALGIEGTVSFMNEQFSVGEVTITVSPEHAGKFTAIRDYVKKRRVLNPKLYRRDEVNIMKNGKAQTGGALAGFFKKNNIVLLLACGGVLLVLFASTLFGGSGEERQPETSASETLTNAQFVEQTEQKLQNILNGISGGGAL